MTQSSPNSLPVSVEFFPPKTPEGVEKLAAVRQQLYALQPQFCSVTYGAGGSTQEGTFATVREILAEGQDAASHFSCIGATRESVRAELAQLQAMGVRRLVALRQGVKYFEPPLDPLAMLVALTSEAVITGSSSRVLLVDDLIDSRWPMTVAGRLLRLAGAPSVLPLALASVA